MLVVIGVLEWMSGSSMKINRVIRHYIVGLIAAFNFGVAIENLVDFSTGIVFIVVICGLILVLSNIIYDMARS
jgi:hypothetical protein